MTGSEDSIDGAWGVDQFLRKLFNESESERERRGGEGGERGSTL